MPPRRSASSLSFAEARQGGPLESWVDSSISEALAEARRKGRPVLHVSATKPESELPLEVFESSIEDVHFFAGRGRVVLGLGATKAFDLAHAKDVAEFLRSCSVSPADFSKVVLAGGWGFQPQGKKGKGVWRDFPSSRWVIPAITLTSSRGESVLTMVVNVGPSSDATRLRALYRTLIRGLGPRGTAPQGQEASAASLPSLMGARSIPSGKSWTRLAKEAVDSISKGDLKKVVLSRAVELTFSSEVPTSSVIRRLLALNPDSAVFAIKRKGSVFLGATPESLLSARKGDVEVDCLAASTPRSADKSLDQALGEQLLADPKSSREHQFVVRAAVGALSPISSRIEVPGAPALKKLATIQHLYTPVRAKLNEGQDVWRAALALWPNPAIGGEPKEKAVRWIRRFERLDRGWYSGVVGVMDARQDEADLVVAIRSGVVRGHRAVIYAGAGLVEGSRPREELEETGWKLRTMSRALGVELEGMVT